MEIWIEGVDIKWQRKHIPQESPNQEATKSIKLTSL